MSRKRYPNQQRDDCDHDALFEFGQLENISHFRLRKLRQNRQTIVNWVFSAGLAKTFLSQSAGIALATRASIRQRIIAAVSQRKIDPELNRLSNNLGFRHFDQGRGDLKPRTLDSCFGGDIREGLEQSDGFGL